MQVWLSSAGGFLCSTNVEEGSVTVVSVLCIYYKGHVSMRVSRSVALQLLLHDNLPLFT